MSWKRLSKLCKDIGSVALGFMASFAFYRQRIGSRYMPRLSSRIYSTWRSLYVSSASKEANSNLKSSKKQGLSTSMTTEREVSHLQACSSHDIDCPISKSSSNQSPPKCRSSRRASNIQRNLNEVSLLDLLRLARRLKYPTLTTLRLFVSLEDQPRGRLHVPLKDGCRLWNWEYAWDYVTSTQCALLYVYKLVT